MIIKEFQVHKDMTGCTITFWDQSGEPWESRTMSHPEVLVVVERLTKLEPAPVRLDDILSLT